MKHILVVIILLTLSGCYKAENSLTLGKPDYGKRDIQVTDVDLEILRVANALLIRGA